MAEKRDIKTLVYLKKSITTTGLALTEQGGLQDMATSYHLNDFHKCALEEALRIKETHGGKVVVLVIGRSKNDKILKDALAVGADEAIRIWDDAVDNSDPFVLAKIISRAATVLGYDLILTGAEDDEDVCTHICPVLAQLLGFQYANLVNEINLENETAVVNRELEQGQEEKLEIDLPAVFSIQAGINLPRYTSISGMMKAKKKPIKNMSLQDIDLTREDVGESGSMTVTQGYYFPENMNKAEILKGSRDDIAQKVRQIIADAEVI